jgi:hypothetical protein
VKDLPLLEGYDESGESTGEFTVSDTVEVTLRDPETLEVQRYELAVGPGQNRFSLVWDPGPPAVGPSAGASPVGVRSAKGPDPPGEAEFELLPNTPNPFN